MARSSRFLAFLAIPLAGCNSLSSSEVTVYADAESEVTVELLDAKQRVEATVDLHPGERATLEGKPGKHTVRSTKRDGAKHEIALNLERNHKYAAPTSPDQCFAILNIGPWYSSKSRNVDVAGARVEQRTSRSGPYGFPADTYGTIDETPETLDYTKRPKLVTAFPCAKLAQAADADILATLDGPVGTTTLTSSQGHRAHAPSGPRQFVRLMSEQKKDWTRVHEDEGSLAYRRSNGDFLIVDAKVIPGEDAVAENPRAMSELIGRLDEPNVEGVYHKEDLLPSLLLKPGPRDQAVAVGGARAGLVLRHADDEDDAVAPPEAFAAIGGDLAKIALENAKARYKDVAAKCLDKPAKPRVCTEDPTEATAILLIARDAPKPKGKIWFRLDDRSLQIAKASKKIPTTGFGDPAVDDPMLFTLQKNELKSGLE